MTTGLRFAACLIAITGTAVCAAAPIANHAQADRSSVTRLTSAKPQALLPLPPRSGTASELVLRVAAINNPDRIPISLDVALAPCSTSDKWEPERVTVLGVFPVDQPGTYAAPVETALARVRGKGIEDPKR